AVDSVAAYIEGEDISTEDRTNEQSTGLPGGFETGTQGGISREGFEETEADPGAPSTLGEGEVLEKEQVPPDSDNLLSMVAIPVMLAFLTVVCLLAYSTARRRRKDE
ncbi:MAG: hypothetical protein KAT70_04240, partial [Thermoplasmata archaeon]|nr:hypothetical protein [Thermoplasmata archaeon]